MIIVLEGPDGAGKSTLAADLSQRLNIPVFKPSETPLHGQTVEESWAQDNHALDLLESCRPDIIFDRFFPSEYAYGREFGRALNETLIAEQSERLWDLGAHCFMFTHRHLTNGELEARLDDEVALPRVRRIDDFYQEYVKNLAKFDFQWTTLDSSTPLGWNVQAVMRKVIDARPSKDEVFMQLAHEVSKRSTCLSRRIGAVMVSEENHVIATGYNGSPVNCPHPTSCSRLTEAVASGTNLDLCGDVHAEENAVAQCAKYGHSCEGGRLFTILSPCNRCARMLINAGVKEVIYERPYGDLSGLEQLVDAGIVVKEMK